MLQITAPTNGSRITNAVHPSLVREILLLRQTLLMIHRSSNTRMTATPAQK